MSLIQNIPGKNIDPIVLTEDNFEFFLDKLFEYEKSFRQPYLIHTEKVWRLMVKMNMFKFTEDDYGNAKNNELGFLGTQHGVNCYLVI